MVKRGWRLVPVVLLGIAALAGGRARADEGADAKKAVENFLTAVQTGDEKGATAALRIAPEQNAAVTAFLDLGIATVKLQKAAEAKFGSSTASTFGTASGAQMEDRLKAIREAPVKIAGESAILTVPADEATKVKAVTIVLVKAGTGWKIDAASLYPLNSEKKEETDRQVALAGRSLAITKQMIQEINDGKYAAAVDAYQEFWARLAKAETQGKPAATTGAATQGGK